MTYNWHHKLLLSVIVATQQLLWQLAQLRIILILPAGPPGLCKALSGFEWGEHQGVLPEGTGSTAAISLDTGMARERAMVLGRAALVAARRAVVAPQAACLQSANYATGQEAAAKEPLKPSSPNHIIVTVNDKQVEVLKGATVMAACEAAGIDIPRQVPCC